jgi:hypothetical protein
MVLLAVDLFKYPLKTDSTLARRLLSEKMNGGGT